MDYDIISESSLFFPEREIQDLYKFWNDLSWYEREESLEIINNFIVTQTFSHKSPDSKQRIEKVQQEYEKLSNANKRPLLKKIFSSSNNQVRGPRYRICIDIIDNDLSYKGLVHFAQYLDLDESIVNSFNDSELRIYIRNYGANCSLSAFFAYQKYLGKIR